jgi:5-methylcytosine-specific restriction endonuclease McrA
MMTYRCRQCGKPSMSGHYCSQECLDQYRDLNAVRKGRIDRDIIFRRDKGVCARCNLDTEKLSRVIGKALDLSSRRYTGEGIRRQNLYYRARRFLDKLIRRYPWAFQIGQSLQVRPHLWEADHSLARCRGGSDSIKNIKTLCVGCHRGKTKQDLRLRREDA